MYEYILLYVHRRYRIRTVLIQAKQATVREQSEREYGQKRAKEESIDSHLKTDKQKGTTVFIVHTEP